MRLPRRVHKLWARWMGYFWLPCDQCGYEFGGHEKGWKARGLGHPDLLCVVCVIEAEFWERVAIDYARNLPPLRPNTGDSTP